MLVETMTFFLTFDCEGQCLEKKLKRMGQIILHDVNADKTETISSTMRLRVKWNNK